MTAVPEAVRWHDIECGSYAQDLPLWRELAAEYGDPVLEVGAGTGRVSLHLARHGHSVIALDRDADLLTALEADAERLGVAVATVASDARDFALASPASAGLCLVPMQTIQLLGGPGGRAGFLASARRALRDGGVLAAALAEPLDGFDPDVEILPLPDLREEDGWVYASQPLAVRVEGARTAIERRRETVSPAGERTESHDTVYLDHLTADELEAEVSEHGFAVLERRYVEPTEDHVGSEVVVLHAG